MRSLHVSTTFQRVSPLRVWMTPGTLVAEPSRLRVLREVWVGIVCETAPCPTSRAIHVPRLDLDCTLGQTREPRGAGDRTLEPSLPPTILGRIANGSAIRSFRPNMSSTFRSPVAVRVIYWYLLLTSPG